MCCVVSCAATARASINLSTADTQPHADAADANSCQWLAHDLEPTTTFFFFGTYYMLTYNLEHDKLSRLRGQKMKVIQGRTYWLR